MCIRDSRKYPALYEIDNNWDGFEWMNADDAEHSTYSLSLIHIYLRWHWVSSMQRAPDVIWNPCPHIREDV